MSGQARKEVTATRLSDEADDDSADLVMWGNRFGAGGDEGPAGEESAEVGALRIRGGVDRISFNYRR